MARDFAHVARDRPRIGPEDLPGAIGILADADRPGDIVGIAFGAGHVGRTAAVLYSFTGTCKHHDIDPFAYLQDVLRRLARRLVQFPPLGTAQDGGVNSLPRERGLGLTSGLARKVGAPCRTDVSGPVRFMRGRRKTGHLSGPADGVVDVSGWTGRAGRVGQ
jgi:hypothetical protein